MAGGSRARQSTGASALPNLDSTGTIAVGKRADLVLLAGNPLQDIRHTRELAGVMLGGRWLDRAELDRRLTAPVGKTSRALGWLSWEMTQALSPGLSAAQSPALTPHRASFLALADSLAMVPEGKTSERQRMSQLIAEQLGAIRATLASQQHEGFDPLVRVWLRQQARQGVRVTVPNVAPSP